MGMAAYETTDGDAYRRKLTFVLPSDSNFKERDTLIWKVRYQFLENGPDTTLAALMAMQILLKTTVLSVELKK